MAEKEKQIKWKERKKKKKKKRKEENGQNKWENQEPGNESPQCFLCYCSAVLLLCPVSQVVVVVALFCC